MSYQGKFDLEDDTIKELIQCNVCGKKTPLRIGASNFWHLRSKIVLQIAPVGGYVLNDVDICTNCLPDLLTAFKDFVESRVRFPKNPEMSYSPKDENENRYQP